MRPSAARRRIMFDEIRNEEVETDNGLADPAMVDKALEADAAGFVEPPRELTIDEKLACIEDAVTKHPLNREILYKILAFCEERRDLAVIEAEVATYPEFRLATQNQFHMISVLVSAHGLELIELDEAGGIVLPEQKEGLTEDEVDDLVFSYSYKTTEAGLAFVERHRPRARLVELLELAPERSATYVEVLEFVRERPRSYSDVQSLLRGRPVLETVKDGIRETMQPSVFIDKLERSGALVWNGGWTLTKEGIDFLEDLKANA